MIATKYASILKRFAAFLVDLIICKIIVLVLEAPFGLIYKPVEFAGDIFGHLGIHNPFDWFLGHFPMWTPDFHGMLSGWMFVVIYVLYFAVFEGSWRQATPGKMLMGIFVTDLGGKRISYHRALGRSLGRVLSVIICFIGFLVALFTARSQALHDILADTLVLEPEYGLSAPRAQPPGSTGEGGSEAQTTGQDKESPTA